MHKLLPDDGGQREKDQRLPLAALQPSKDYNRSGFGPTHEEGTPDVMAQVDSVDPVCVK